MQMAEGWGAALAELPSKSPRQGFLGKITCCCVVGELLNGRSHWNGVTIMGFGSSGLGLHLDESRHMEKLPHLPVPVSSSMK